MQRRLLVLIALICCAPIIQAQSTIFLVRHAEKADASSGADAKDPDLSVAGHVRAESLAKILKDAGVTAIYATEFKRTQQTAEPLARALGIKVATLPGKEINALVSKLKEAKGNTLVVGHSNTLPEIISELGISAPPTIDEATYDNLFVLQLGERPQLIRLHY